MQPQNLFLTSAQLERWSNDLNAIGSASQNEVIYDTRTLANDMVEVKLVYGHSIVFARYTTSGDGKYLVESPTGFRQFSRLGAALGLLDSMKGQRGVYAA